MTHVNNLIVVARGLTNIQATCKIIKYFFLSKSLKNAKSNKHINNLLRKNVQ